MESEKWMNDFQTFKKAVGVGNLKEVRNSFKTEFLEIEDNSKLRQIHLACETGHLEVVKFLFQNNCNLECEDILKVQPIHFACENGHLGVVKFLFQNKCNLECEDILKVRPIHLACRNGHLRVVKFLFQNKCRIECHDYLKWRPIHYACWKGHLEVVKVLIQYNCQLDCRTSNGETPIGIARKWGHKGCEKFLNEILELKKNALDHRNQDTSLHKSKEHLEIPQPKTKQFPDFHSCRDAISLFTTKHEPGIMSKIKDNANLNQSETIAVNLVFWSLKQMGQFHDRRTEEINEILVNYLDKYQGFAHQNVVAMRLTEVILYSFCSSECRSLVVPENYFLKYFHKKYSPEIQIGAAVANSFVEKELSEKSKEEVILLMLNILKEKDTKEPIGALKKIKNQYENEGLMKSGGTLWGFSREEVENCLYKEILKWSGFLKKPQEPTFPKSLYPILCQILEGINHLDSSQIYPLPLMSINIFIEKHKSDIFNKWKDNRGELNAQNKIALNCFYVSINILSKCCLVSERIPLDEMLLLKTFEDFSDFNSSNFISQRICEALLYCICNVVDKREIRDKGSWVKTFETCFLNSKVSTEIHLASAYIWSYLITEEDIKFTVLEYLTDVLGNPTMQNCKSYFGFRDSEIKKCFETLKFKKSCMESLKTALNNIFTSASQFSRLKTWFIERSEIPKGYLSRCRSFDDLFYEIWKTEQFDSMIEFVKNGGYEKDDHKIEDVMNCWENVKRQGNECPRCKGY